MTTDLTSAPPAASSEPPQWPALQPGENVDITIAGAVVAYVNKQGVPEFTAGTADDPNRFLHLPQTGAVTITRSAPADGVPQPGELWADETGRQFFAHRDAGFDLVQLTTEDGYSYPWREVHTGPDGPIRRIATVEQIASWT